MTLTGPVIANGHPGEESGPALHVKLRRLAPLFAGMGVGQVVWQSAP